MIGRAVLAIGKVVLVISRGYGLDRLGAVGDRLATIDDRSGCLDDRLTDVLDRSGCIGDRLASFADRLNASPDRSVKISIA